MKGFPLTQMTHFDGVQNTGALKEGCNKPRHFLYLSYPSLHVYRTNLTWSNNSESEWRIQELNKKKPINQRKLQYTEQHEGDTHRKFLL